MKHHPIDADAVLEDLGIGIPTLQQQLEWHRRHPTPPDPPTPTPASTPTPPPPRPAVHPPSETPYDIERRRHARAYTDPMPSLRPLPARDYGHVWADEPSPDGHTRCRRCPAWQNSLEASKPCPKTKK